MKKTCAHNIEKKSWNILMEIMQGEIKIRKIKTRTEHNETDHSRERRPFNPEGGWSGKDVRHGSCLVMCGKEAG